MRFVVIELFQGVQPWGIHFDTIVNDHYHQNVGSQQVVYDDRATWMSLFVTGKAVPDAGNGGKCAYDIAMPRGGTFRDISAR